MESESEGWRHQNSLAAGPTTTRTYDWSVLTNFSTSSKGSGPKPKATKACVTAASDVERKREAHVSGKDAGGGVTSVSSERIHFVAARSNVAKVRRVQRNTEPWPSSQRFVAPVRWNCSAEVRPCFVRALESKSTALSGNGSFGTSVRDVLEAHKFCRREEANEDKDWTKTGKDWRRPIYFFSFCPCHDSCACVPEADPGCMRWIPHHQSAV